jgi:thiamine biosynthesis protein ThiI
MILVRYGEIGIKSRKVRNRLEKLLVRNIQKTLNFNDIPYSSITRDWGRIFVDSGSEAIPVISRVFGVVSCSEVIEIEANIDRIIQMSVEIMSNVMDGKESFAIRARRKKDFPVTSKEIESMVGKEVLEATGKKVNLSSPDVTLYIEVRPPKAYLYNNITQGVGGLPFSSQGKVLVMWDSPFSSVAAWYMMRRGCIPGFIIPHDSVAGAMRDIQGISLWCPGYSLNVVKADSGESFLTSAFKSAKDREYMALISGLNSISEELFRLFKEMKAREPSIPVFFPLIAFDNKQISHKLEEIRAKVKFEELTKEHMVSRKIIKEGHEWIVRDGYVQ